MPKPRAKSELLNAIGAFVPLDESSNDGAEVSVMRQTLKIILLNIAKESLTPPCIPEAEKKRLADLSDFQFKI